MSDSTVFRLPGLRGKRPARAPEHRLPLRYAHEYAKAESTFSALLDDAPESADVSGGITDWGMLANGPDSTLTPPRVPVGDCTYAARQHYRMAKAAAAGTLQSEAWETSDELDDEYLEQNDGEDTGEDIPTILLDWYKAGKIRGFAPLDPSDRRKANAAMVVFHGEYIGCDLTDDADARFSQHVAWSVANGQQPDPEDGHCIVRVAYDPTHDTYVTWGALQLAEIDWSTECVTERYILITSEDEAANMDMAVLVADIEAIVGGQSIPAPVAPTPPVDPPVAPPAPVAPPVPDPTPVVDPPAPVDPTPEDKESIIARLIKRAEELIEKAIEAELTATGHLHLAAAEELRRLVELVDDRL